MLCGCVVVAASFNIGMTSQDHHLQCTKWNLWERWCAQTACNQSCVHDAPGTFDRKAVHF